MATERETLLDFLDMQRQGALKSVEGLSEEALRSSALPSGWTCLGMFQHLTVNERYWLRWAVGGERIPGTDIVNGRCQVVLDNMPNPDDDWLVAPDASAETVLSRYREEVEKANAAIADVLLDGPPRRSDPPWAEWFGADTLDARWIILHMIEETAQHAGHLDIVRELLDDRDRSAG